MTVMCVSVMLAGCKKSTITAQTEAQTNPDGSVIGQIEKQETTHFQTASYEYVIPEGAKGPGDAYIVGDPYEFYPEDRKPQATENPIIQVKYFYVNAEGLIEDFDIIEGTECDAQDLIDILMNDGCLMEGTEVVSFESDGEQAVVELNQLEGQYQKATEEQLAQAVANTLTDNLYLDYLTVKVGDKTFGPLEYEY